MGKLSDDAKICNVVVPPKLEQGRYANAFRVVPFNEDECYLDFLTFTPQTQQAVVVSRIQVSLELVFRVRDWLTDLLDECTETSDAAGDPAFDAEDVN